MKTRPTFRALSRWTAYAALAVAAACSSDSPTEPTRSPGPPPGTGGASATYNVTVTASPGTVAAGSDDPVVVTVRAVRTDNGQPAPNDTIAVITATEGSFGAPGGENAVTVSLIDGAAQVQYFPPTDDAGTVVIRATVAGSVGSTSITILEAATFFISFVDPNVGSPTGGEEVFIHGSGFDEPVRVSFGGANARVLSVSPTRIRVIAPESLGPLNERRTVDVTVTINVNQEDQASDTLPGAYTYAPGGSPDQPAIFTVTPSSGPNEGGTRVSIIGSGFVAPLRVDFCASGTCVEAEVLNVTSTRVEARSPAATGFGSGLRNANATVRVQNINSGLFTELTQAFRYGVSLVITGIAPDLVNAENPGLVTIFGEGFENPLLVLLDGKEQAVISVTGSQVVFRPDPFPITGCPPEGAVIGTRGVSVRLLTTNVEVGSPVSLKYTADIPRPQVVSVQPNSGPGGGGTAVTVGGSGFDAPVRVQFGGSVASVGNVTSTQIQVTTPAFAGTFPTEACTAPGDVPGTRSRPTSVAVTVTNLDTGCTDTLPGSFTYQPDTTCVPNEAPEPDPVECEDGFDNDGDGFIDAADPECTGPGDDDESA